MRPTRFPTIPILALTIALAGCGGDEAAEQSKADQGGAETAVRSYLAALVDKDGRAACSTFTPEYQQSLMREYRDFAREKGADDCAALIDATARATRTVTFEGKRLTRETIGELRFRTTVRQSGEELNGTVDGMMGIQRYVLETRDGDWLIADIERIR